MFRVGLAKDAKGDELYAACRQLRRKIGLRWVGVTFPSSVCGNPKDASVVLRERT